MVLLALAGCGAAATPPDTPPRPPPPPYELPGSSLDALSPLAGSAPRLLPGMEDLDLDRREATLFGQVIGELFSPCSEQAVSIRQCVEEARPCAGCRPAARLLAEKVKEGATADQAREIYALRFGPAKPVDTTGSPALGPASAPVTVAVWFDFECPHCRTAVPTLDRFAEELSPHVRVVHKFYPLQYHLTSIIATRAAIAAQIQGKYREMERLLFDHASAHTEADVARYAKQIGLDLRRFHEDMGSPRTLKHIERDHEEAERLNLTGTPHIVVNGRVFDTAYFHVEPDLEAWVKLDVQLLTSKR